MRLSQLCALRAAGLLLASGIMDLQAEIQELTLPKPRATVRPGVPALADQPEWPSPRAEWWYEQLAEAHAAVLHELGFLNLDPGVRREQKVP